MERVFGCTLALSAGLFALSAQAQTYVSYADLALHHAPIHYQDTDSSDYPSEYLTAFDYDGDWVATNNWDNRGNGLWPATVYYSVVESCSHYFIVYAFFHPRDWSDTIFDQEHENDLEGALIAVRKNSGYGTLEAMVTVYHNDFYSYTPDSSSYTDRHEDIDGLVSFQSYGGLLRPMTVQQAKGHGLKAFPYTSNFSGASNEDGVIYFPTAGAANYPTSGNDRHVDYRLEPVTASGGMWARAISEASTSGSQNLTYHSFGTFRGDQSGGCGSGWKSCSENSANAPWGWDDGNDGAVYKGEMALDPAHLVDHYFNGLGTFSQQYVYNPFLQDLMDAGYNSATPPVGFASQLDLNSMFAKLVNSCN